jgi:hypothetical protein
VNKELQKIGRNRGLVGCVVLRFAWNEQGKQTKKNENQS